MPRWDVHLSFGMMAFIIIFSALLFGSRPERSLIEYMETASFFGLTLLLGGAALIFGSVLPDIDGKGRIRWIIGPIIGGLLFFPFFIGAFRSGGPLQAMEFIRGFGSFLFLAGTAAGYLILLVPKRHRGLWHSNRAVILYGGIWGVYVFCTASFPIDQSVVIGSMGTIGYGWHLALDGKLL